MMKVLLLLLVVAVDAAPCMDSQQCASCDDSNERCLSQCNDGYYGFKCDQKCRIGCRFNICHMNNNGNDECTHGCKPGYYGSRCNIPCATHNDTCNECPQECEGGFCKLGLSCAHGCQDSYYGTACKSCPAGCEVCDRVSGTCKACLPCEGDCTHGCKDGCRAGYFGGFCQHICSSGCASGCHQISGDCFKCKSGFYGASCDIQCPDSCKDVECDRVGRCTHGCTAGWYGLRCEFKCSSICSYRDCDKVGICAQGCAEGWSGLWCESKCEAGCAWDKCQRNGDCVGGCKAGFYGKLCRHTCSGSCFQNMCNVEDGSCKSCEKGFYGSHCEKSCVRCVDAYCIQDTGHCIHKCLPNYRGMLCQHDCAGNCTADECRKICGIDLDTNKLSDDDSPDYIPYTVATTAAVVLIVAALFIYAACRFKRSQSVSNGSMIERQCHQLQPQRTPTEEATVQTVNLYSEVESNSLTPDQIPRRCGTHVAPSVGSDSPKLLPRRVHEEADGEGVTVNNEKTKDHGVTADSIRRLPTRQHSYLSPFAPDIDEEGVDGVTSASVPMLHTATVGFDESPLGEGDLMSTSGPQECSPDFSCLGDKVSKIPPEDATEKEINDVSNVMPCEFNRNRHLKVDSTALQEGCTRARILEQNPSEILKDSAEDTEVDGELSTIPVIADCYDNFFVDDEEEALPNPPPGNYSKLFTHYSKKDELG